MEASTIWTPACVSRRSRVHAPGLVKHQAGAPWKSSVSGWNQDEDGSSGFGASRMDLGVTCR